MADPFDRVLRAAARRGRGGGVCPDADVLAAYLDNGLTSDERAAVESHAADCVRCQEHLALVGAVSVERGDPEEPRSWLVRWGWLVPVATAVLVVVVWTRTPSPTETPAQPAGERAAARADDAQPKATPPAASAESEAPTEAPPPAAPASPSLDARAPSPQRQEGAGAAAGFERRRDNLARAAKAAPPPPASATPPPVAEADRVGQLADAARNAEEKEQAPARALKKSETVPLLRAGVSGLIVSASPTETYRAEGSRVEQSSDGGTTWSEAFSDASLTFTAAACAEGGVCWFGTTTGVIVRTSPEGFVRSQLPERAAVVAITAGRGLAATATAGGHRYETSDGVRWTLQTP